MTRTGAAILAALLLLPASQAGAAVSARCKAAMAPVDARMALIRKDAQAFNTLPQLGLPGQKVTLARADLGKACAIWQRQNFTPYFTRVDEAEGLARKALVICKDTANDSMMMSAFTFLRDMMNMRINGVKSQCRASGFGWK